MHTLLQMHKYSGYKQGRWAVGGYQNNLGNFSQQYLAPTNSVYQKRAGMEVSGVCN